MRRCCDAPHADLAASDRLARKKEVEKRPSPARARRGGRRARKSLFLRAEEADGDVPLAAAAAAAAGRTICAGCRSPLQRSVLAITPAYLQRERLVAT